MLMFNWKVQRFEHFQISEQTAVVVEKPRVTNVAYIPNLKQGFVDLSHEQGEELTEQVFFTFFFLFLSVLFSIE